MWTNLLPCRKVHSKIEIIICRSKIFNHTVSACLQIYSGSFDPCPFPFIIRFRNLVTKDCTHNPHSKYVLGFKHFLIVFPCFLVSIPDQFSLFYCIGDTYEVVDWVKNPLPCLGKSLPLPLQGQDSTSCI